MFLPDVNLWLALAFASHVHHGSARSWFGSSANDGCSFCRMTQQGFLRLATNPRTAGITPVTLSDAWRLYDAFRNDRYVYFVAEPAAVEPLWRAYTQGQSFSPKLWNDAYLAAFARAAGYKLVTFDKGFARYKEVDCTILEDLES